MIPAAMRPLAASLFTLFLIVVANWFPAKAANCESLSAVNLPDTTIIGAQSIAAGKFTPPYGGPLEKDAGFLPRGWSHQADERFLHSV